MKKYIYPKLPAKCDLGVIRLAGNGLANGMFIAARAFLRSRRESLEMIEPTWANFGLGKYWRREADKRHYFNLFIPYNRNHGWKKLGLLLFRRRQIEVEQGLAGYFTDLLGHSSDVKRYFEKIIRPDVLEKVNAFDFTDCAALHVRLGDFPLHRRTPLEWYTGQIKTVNRLLANKNLQILLFSDGTDEQLAPILKYSNVRRVFFGNALADIWAIGRCRFLIGSDSTFSGWGAYLGQVPAVFCQKHYGRVLDDETKECVGDEIGDADVMRIITGKSGADIKISGH